MPMVQVDVLGFLFPVRRPTDPHRSRHCPSCRSSDLASASATGITATIRIGSEALQAPLRQPARRREGRGCIPCAPRPGGDRSPVCTFQQNGNQLTGTCTGPNSRGSAVGLVNGAGVTFQWQMISTDSIGLSGIASFSGKLGPDSVVRGSWTFSGRPGARGQFTAQRT